MFDFFALLVSFELGVSMGLLFIFGNVNYRKVMSLESIALILSIKNFIYRHPYFLLFLKIIILI